MGFVIVKLVQGLAAVLMLLFLGLAIFHCGKVLFKGLTKEKK